MRNAVTDSNTGAVKRHGWVDFTSDGQFDASTEVQVALDPDTTPPAGVPLKYVKVSSGRFVEMTDAEKLPGLKQDRYAEVDAKTQELIEQGFEYPSGSGKVFSLSLNAQSYIQELYNARNTLAYPVHLLTKQNDDFVDLQDATEVTTFFETAGLTVKGHRDSGNSLKDQIRGASTKTELDAIVDNR